VQKCLFFNDYIVSDMELISACQAEVKESSINLKGLDPSPLLKMSDPKVKEGWPRAYQKEIKTQIDSKSFALDAPNEGEHIIPEMEIN